MNELEKFVYSKVKKIPMLKAFVVWLYQFIFSPFGKQGLSIGHSHVVLKNQYFGFHDKSPFNSDGSIVLGFRPPVIFKKISRVMAGDVLINYGENWNNELIIDSTVVWNTIMGPMLHWYDDINNVLVYNSKIEDKLISILHNVNSKSFVQMQEPCVHSNSIKGLFCCYNLEDAEKGMPGYGIPTNLVLKQNYKFIVFDINNNVELKLTNEDVKELVSVQTDFIWVHHCLFSPNGEFIFFLLRWYNKLGERQSELFIYKTSEKVIEHTGLSGMISHLTWKNNFEILVYLGTNPDYQDAFYNYNIINKVKTRLNNNYFSDGHPTSLDETKFIYDSYPDKFRHQYLYVFSAKDQRRDTLARNKLPLKSKGAFQYDLHPRKSVNSKLISIDCLTGSNLNQVIIDVES